MLGHRYRLPLALVVTAIAAGGATLLLRPRSGVVSPASASAGDYFTAQQLERAHEFRAPQRKILLASLALEASVLILLVAKPPRGFTGVERRPLAGAAAAGAALTVGVRGITLPLSAISERRSRDFGLSTQTWGSWASDGAKSTAIGAVMTAVGSSMGMALIRRFPAQWWLPGSAAGVGLSALMAFASPVVIDPLFNKFEPLPAGTLRSEVLDLAGRADVNVG